jgi:hypothetical protein
MERTFFESDRELIKERIKSLFDQNVRGKSPHKLGGNSLHDGSDGHWLQVQFGLEADNKNAPDLLGFELKTGTRGKTTFGDWSADRYLFYSHQKCEASTVTAESCVKCSNSNLSRPEFFKLFGSPNPMKNGRFSWSGEVFPKVGLFNQSGQKMNVDESGNISTVYLFEEDKRVTRNSLVPPMFQTNLVETAFWSSQTLKERLEKKFNVLGWFKCLRESNGSGPYTQLVFGKPIDFPTWINLVRSGHVYLDSGMYDGNNRPYQNWRASNSVWDSLSEELY